MKKQYLYALFAVAAVSLAANSAFAAAITVGDHSFETNAGGDLAAGGWSDDLGAEWLETGGPASNQAFEEHIAGFSADGTDHLGMNNLHSVWQDLGVTFQANTIYTLTVATGNRDGQSSAGNLSTYGLFDTLGTQWAQLQYDAFANVAVGTFGDAPSLVFDTSANPGAVGQTIRIQLDALNAAGGGTGRSHFDNIRLDAIPEPSGFALLGLGSLLMLRRRR